MATLAEQINKIKSAKADLATAIKAKGGTLTDGAKLADFDVAVTSIESVGSPKDETLKIVLFQ